MSLDSTENLSNVHGDKSDTTLDTRSGVEMELLSLRDKDANGKWCYLFVHRSKLSMVEMKLKKSFTTFIHRSVVIARKNKGIKCKERITISGLLFVQGDVDKIKSCLSENFYGLHLVNDCSTGRTAVIPDALMRPFMQISDISPDRIRFMPHPFKYYSEGHPLVRITSGALKGLEGYQVRISRDRCLVTSLGGMTVAIGGVSKDTFENVQEFIRRRREQLNENSNQPERALTPVEANIESCFFTPHDQLDLMAIAGGLDVWVNKARAHVDMGRFDDAVNIVLFILEETGRRFHSIYNDKSIGRFKDLTSTCRTADAVLTSVAANAQTPTELSERIEVERQSLSLRYSFLPIE